MNSELNLFNNPMVKSAKESMKKEDLEMLKDWGEAVFGNIDFESGQIEQYPAPMIDALVYIENSLKSGQHPSTLTDEEKELLEKIKGEDWFKEWGYVKEDLNDIITLKF